ncbi:hypothetical protein PtrSN002B_007087 [Pyrenophora tritici-repentis]|uniref:Extracellular membrane protein CFEM domain-containing protein n=1 Tax=Pyrenophora tritici-repentis TaxID=45151 RepID=A0A2W1GMC4_9PLEO|nr:hypothetical protein PtrV1_04478 [Pyrenophora tritici-repentis]KAF7452166.1 hypothetical protein A1F99_039430 [Pyrenophora tritici-repentis]KAF7574716.1 hypothetical protein PtrM4_063400 [Pyrenophora tritici-repentis]KAG9386511.1 hypothetical protein A1F94_003261 [Pyrenophora tritici-repentis]KAI0586921.1 hypothetical protein Alg130_04017 [Pyrenophora tritici-repentis]
MIMQLILLTIILASLAAAAIPTQQQCAAAESSCHTSCSSLRNNLNICICNTPGAPEDACHDAQVAYTNCAVKKCVQPEQRRADDVGDVPRWVLQGGRVVAYTES